MRVGKTVFSKKSVKSITVYKVLNFCISHITKLVHSLVCDGNSKFYALVCLTFVIIFILTLLLRVQRIILERLTESF